MYLDSPRLWIFKGNRTFILPLFSWRISFFSIIRRWTNSPKRETYIVTSGANYPQISLSLSLVKASGNGSKLSEQRGRGGLRVTSRGEQTNKVFARIQQRFRAICRIIRLIGSSTYKRTPVNGEFASNPFSRATLVECIIITRSAGFRASSLC